MNSPPVEPMPLSDLRSDPLSGLVTVASIVLTTHTNDAGLCAECAAAWPCHSAALAEHTLAGL